MLGRRSGARGRTSVVLALACAASLVPASGAGAASGGPALKAAWVELGPVRVAVVRAITDADACPRMRVNGERRTMRVRAAPDPPDFAVLTCERSIGRHAKRISVAGTRLRPPTRRPRRIAVVGDTGCRLAGPEDSQACNDPAQWPFRRIARRIAKWEPELIVHVGDYLYREQPCPPGDAGCANSPSGDNWPTWNADFFRPAAAAMRAAPWVLVRGNHEVCSRAGEGWFRFLHPRRPPARCKDFTHPYAVRLGHMRMLVLDSANASDFEPFNPEPYESQFAAVDRMVGPRGGWLLTHRPLWGLAATDDGASFAVTNTTLQMASGNSLPGRVQAVISGHLHTAEVFGFAGRRAPQLVAGNGGTLLDSQITAPIVGTDAAGARIVEALARSEFGFLTLARRSPGWALAVRDVDGRPISRCRMARKSAPCGTD